MPNQRSPKMDLDLEQIIIRKCKSCEVPKVLNLYAINIINSNEARVRYQCSGCLDIMDYHVDKALMKKLGLNHNGEEK